MIKNSVYISDIKTIIPKRYTYEDIIEKAYSNSNSSRHIIELAKRTAKKINIHSRPLILDLNAYPEKKILKPEYSSLNWGVYLIDKLTKKINKNEIGFLGIAYNISSHEISMPNLASQIATRSGLNLIVPPEEKVYYGCASGIFVLKNAFDFCQKYNKAAIVYIFDQCSWTANVITDTKDPNFKNSLKNNLLFADGGVGLLLIPEALKRYFKTALLRLENIKTEFSPDVSMYYSNNEFFLDEQTHEKVPQLVAEKIIKPIMRQNNLTKNDINEWSFHQGGIPILDEFKKERILGLTEKELLPSKNAFYSYGNLSSPSAFFVLQNYLNNESKKADIGILASFGVGYYLGGFLYVRL